MTADLLAVEPDWVELHDEYDGWPCVVVFDEAVALAAPHAGWPLQLAMSVQLLAPGEDGLPGPAEEARLAEYEQALAVALGRQGRLVAAITLQGVREYVAYLRSARVVEAWQDAPPPGLGSHDADVQLLPDRDWRGLREIAGLLDPDEEPLRPSDPVA